MPVRDGWRDRRTNLLRVTCNLFRGPFLHLWTVHIVTVQYKYARATVSTRTKLFQYSRAAGLALPSLSRFRLCVHVEPRRARLKCNVILS